MLGGPFCDRNTLLKKKKIHFRFFLCVIMSDYISFNPLQLQHAAETVCLGLIFFLKMKLKIKSSFDCEKMCGQGRGGV